LPSRKTYSTRKTRPLIETATVSKNWIKQLHTHFTGIALQPLLNTLRTGDEFSRLWRFFFTTLKGRWRKFVF
jgi:hypothetical protein